MAIQIAGTSLEHLLIEKIGLSDIAQIGYFYLAMKLTNIDFQNFQIQYIIEG